VQLAEENATLLTDLESERDERRRVEATLESHTSEAQQLLQERTDYATELNRLVRAWLFAVVQMQCIVPAVYKSLVSDSWLISLAAVFIQPRRP